MNAIEWTAVIVASLGILATVIAVVVVKRPEDEKTSLTKITVWGTKAIPFLVMLDEEAGNLRPHIHNAVQFWERATPGLFTEEVERTGKIIPVLPASRLDGWGSIRKCHALAYTRITMDKGRMVDAAVYIDLGMAATLSGAIIERALAHELGHVAGLAHDKGKDSVMYETAVEGAYGVTLPDRVYLQEQYGVESAA